VIEPRENDIKVLKVSRKEALLNITRGISVSEWLLGNQTTVWEIMASLNFAKVE
jgi:hypothetical protein